MDAYDIEERAVADQARLTLARVALDAARDELDQHRLSDAALDAFLAGSLTAVVAGNEAADQARREPQGTLW